MLQWWSPNEKCQYFLLSALLLISHVNVVWADDNSDEAFKKAEEYFHRASDFDELGQYDKEIAACTALLSTRRDRPDPPDFLGTLQECSAYALRGDAYRGLCQYQKAIDDYTYAIKLEPSFALMFVRRGAVYRIIGQQVKANQDETTAASLEPKDTPVYIRAFNLDAKDADSFCQRARAWSAIGMPGKAILDYSKAIAQVPNDAKIYAMRANSYCQLEQYDKAVDDYSRAIAIDPRKDVNYTTLRQDAARLILATSKLAIAEEQKLGAIQAFKLSKEKLDTDDSKFDAECKAQSEEARQEYKIAGDEFRAFNDHFKTEKLSFFAPGRSLERMTNESALAQNKLERATKKYDAFDARLSNARFKHSAASSTQDLVNAARVHAIIARTAAANIELLIARLQSKVPVPLSKKHTSLDMETLNRVKFLSSLCTAYAKFMESGSKPSSTNKVELTKAVTELRTAIAELMVDTEHFLKISEDWALVSGDISALKTQAESESNVKAALSDLTGANGVLDGSLAKWAASESE